jgi:hypothetical protein
MLAAPHDATANAILGAPDDLKFHSSMTLFGVVAAESARFAGVASANSPFAGRARRFFDGRRRPGDAAPPRRPLKRVRPARTGGAGLQPKPGAPAYRR